MESWRNCKSEHQTITGHPPPNAFGDSFHARSTPGQHRTMRSISTSDPSAKLVTPTVVRAGKRPGLK